MQLKKQGFTLIELLIVVAIIGILAAIAIPNFLEAQVRAKVANQVSNLRTISLCLESYNVDNTGYPPWYMSYDQNGVPNARFPYHYMTTPIEYISSVDVLMDRFSNYKSYQWYRLQGMAGPVNCWVENNCTMGYDDYSGRTASFESCGKWQGLFSRSHAYVLWGTGPTGRALGAGVCNTSHPLEDVPYDATNGTVSNGHIFRFGPG